MPVTVRSFAKINFGLYIGPLRADGFHELRTVYQTIALHDLIRVSVERGTGIDIRCADPRVPCDSSNTCYRMAERVMEELDATGRVVIEIEKKLPVFARQDAKRSRYYMTDNFLQSWLAALANPVSAIAFRPVDQLVLEADQRLREVEGRALEKLVGQLYEERSRKGRAGLCQIRGM